MCRPPPELELVFIIFPLLGLQRPQVWMQGSLEKAEDATTDDASMWVQTVDFLKGRGTCWTLPGGRKLVTGNGNIVNRSAYLGAEHL